ncbi:hypothetical protein NDU88_000078 [Pleurodeles waltl]|uniref:Uncharacterized protein n=1 Tax=Pleurodeles waltl TaxID=8319 RepID=A0AAV7KM69_PLEWA|nr:hypothetical protein NDU88_000078 [Pleurodeles waltl]
MTGATCDTSDEDINVILMLTPRNQEDNDVVEISSMVAARKRNPPSCIVLVNNRDVKFLADSGSPFTLINMVDFKNFDNMVMQDSHIKIFAYGGKCIEVVGKFEANLQFASKCAAGTVYGRGQDGGVIGRVCKRSAVWARKYSIAVQGPPSRPTPGTSRYCRCGGVPGEQTGSTAGPVEELIPAGLQKRPAWPSESQQEDEARGARTEEQEDTGPEAVERGEPGLQ